ncbi:hypothetical protein [Capnocytophaga leadbetteri]|uniref:hypothetical protein n=1 Tax=Capnocytophaga leadbetteri TaxID=327575 RepID=UPI0028EDDCB5|nr:hypothetical protein [Capnocytophaga leadbetteri]
METVFKVGQKVYDQVYEPDIKGEILDVNMKLSSHPITVKFGSCVRYYTAEGCRGKNTIKTLSTSPYTIQGFEQKAPAPTIKDALEWLRKNDGCDEFDNNYPKKENVFCFEALKKLVILRDYYNEGWQPDWDDSSLKYVVYIEVDNGWNFIIDYRAKYPRVLHFKSKEIAKKFLEEQKELLEIAKPLL